MKRFLVAMFAISFAFTIAACGPEENNNDDAPPELECTIETQKKDCATNETCSTENKCVEKEDEEAECSPTNPEGTCDRQGICQQGVCAYPHNYCHPSNPNVPNAYCDDDKICSTEGICEDPPKTPECTPENQDTTCDPDSICGTAGLCIPRPVACEGDDEASICQDDELCIDDICTPDDRIACTPESQETDCLEDLATCNDDGFCEVQDATD